MYPLKYWWEYKANMRKVGKGVSRSTIVTLYAWRIGSVAIYEHGTYRKVKVEC